MEGGGQYDWNLVVPRVVRPLQVAVVEAMAWIDVPLSASDLQAIFMGQFRLEDISYQLRRLAEIGALVQVEEQPRRGRLRKWFFFVDREWTPGIASYESAA